MAVHFDEDMLRLSDDYPESVLIDKKFPKRPQRRKLDNGQAQLLLRCWCRRWAAHKIWLCVYLST